MKPGARSIVAHFLDLRSILLGFSIFNFTAVWMMDAQIHFACYLCPWYHPWSYFNEPTILLAASLFLNAKRWWGNTAALLLTLYLLGYFVQVFLLYRDPSTTFIDQLSWLLRYYDDTVTSWQTQYLVGLIIFCCALLSLKTDLQSRKRSHEFKD